MLKAEPSPQPPSEGSGLHPARRDSGVYLRTIDPEAALRVLSEADTGVWSCDASHALASPTARRILGFDDTDLPPTSSWLDWVHPGDRERVEVEVERLRSRPGPFAFQARVVHGPDGAARWIEVHGRSHHEEGVFARAGGVVRAAVRRRRDDGHAERGGDPPMVCARRPANLGMIAAAVVDEAQAMHPSRTIHLVLAGQLDGEWDSERLTRAIANLVSRAMEGDADQPVILRVASGGRDVHLLVEGPSTVRRGVVIAREVVRAHGGALHEIATAGKRTRFFAVLPRRPR